ncbi:hypothetical protein Lal_00039267 [Lupinus albus]|nr:hypothetical protein Lal_00039267 [Lupinus albus]
MDIGSSSSAQGGRVNIGMDPYYIHALQADRLGKFTDRKQPYIRYANMAWMAEQGFKFKGPTRFWNIIREFYANFQYMDGKYVRVVKGDGSPLDDYNTKQWSSDESIEIYKSCLQGPHYYVQGELTKVGSTTIENKLMHYLIAYILVQHNTNHAQPTNNDLKLMYDVKEVIMINWPAEILKVMSGITSYSSRLLAYGHVGIDTFNEEVIVVTPREHFIDDSLIHKMRIYKYKDYQAIANIDSNEEDDESKNKNHNLMRLLTCLKNHHLVRFTWMLWYNA